MLPRKTLLLIGMSAALVFSSVGRAQTPSQPFAGNDAASDTRMASRRAPTLGTDMSFASIPSPLIDGWLDKMAGDEMAAAFRNAGLKSLRFSFHGLYSPNGPEATARLKTENKTTNEYQWFPLDAYVDFLRSHDFTTIVGINVEEGPDVARDAIQRFIDRGLKSRIVAIELSNEPWLNYRPWLPEDYAARAADVVERLTPLGVRFALPLTVGRDNKTPTKLSDDEWVTRMLRALSRRIDLKRRSDVYGVLHLYSKGVRGASVDAFNKVVKPFAPNMRYVVTEFNIRLGLEGNPHLTNKYAMEFARKLADVMSRPEIEAMYTHSVPPHSILYWSNGRRFATVVGGRDEKLVGDAMSRGWHLTPTGKVYELYSRLAWNGDVIAYRGGDNQSYWAVRSTDGRTVVTLINDSDKAIRKVANIAGREIILTAPRRSIVCVDMSGKEIERLVLPY
ncbi:MAG TPA: hypothetical protein VNO24_24230 [Blastocatellia bacterium]|nr:hypothetical protein [Blastocatellia bacterium]